ncbi:unannotated protein [freshwater metagenome]|uniref:Unannotated protein n=1 Tax=freshwater metagenome TaxID=449393 RepID=A0A6J6QUD9_9ZZZZ
MSDAPAIANKSRTQINEWTIPAKAIAAPHPIAAKVIARPWNL